MKKLLSLFALICSLQFLIGTSVRAGDDLGAVNDPAITSAITEVIQSNNTTAESIAGTNAQAVEKAKTDGTSFSQAKEALGSSSSNSGPVTVIVSEEVPGAQCKCIGENNCEDLSTRKYECTIAKGMGPFQDMLREILKWFIYIIMLLGVLALVGAGILMAWGSESEEYTKKAKGWAFNIMIGLLLLFTFRYILGYLAPWIFQ